MTLRTMALIAGACGLGMLAAGVVGEINRPDPEVDVTANLETPVVAVAPEVLTLTGLRHIEVSAPGPLHYHSARQVDAQSWLDQRATTMVEGIIDWENLLTRTVARISPAEVAQVTATSPPPSPAVSPSAAEPTAAPSPSGEPTAAPSPSGEPEATVGPDFTAYLGSTDHMRNSLTADNKIRVDATNFDRGEVLVFSSLAEADLTDIKVRIERQVEDGWITPLTIWGGAVTGAALLLFLLTIFDVRPLQARLETFQAQRRKKRQRGVDGAAVPSRRKARRLEREQQAIAGAAVITGQIPQVGFVPGKEATNLPPNAPAERTASMADLDRLLATALGKSELRPQSEPTPTQSPGMGLPEGQVDTARPNRAEEGHDA